MIKLIKLVIGWLSGLLLLFQAAAIGGLSLTRVNFPLQKNPLGDIDNPLISLSISIKFVVPIEVHLAYLCRNSECSPRTK